MSLIEVWAALEIGLIYALVALAVFISFRVLDFPDLTADGSFPLGGAIAATLLVGGMSPWLATGCAILGGMFAGLFTAWLNLKWKILNLLASILTMTALYSINLRIMGRPNVALLDEETIFTPFEALTGSHLYGILLLGGLVILTVGFLFWRFMISDTGLALRATGSNPRMALAQGISIKRTTYLGMGLSNGLIALAGALFAQSQGFADITTGVGTIIFGLAAVIIGEVLIPSRWMSLIILGCILGSIVYRLAVGFALNAGAIGLQTSDLNLVTATLVALAMILPRIRQSSPLSSGRK